MNNKFLAMLLVILLIVSIYLVWHNIVFSSSYNDLKNSYEELGKSYDDLRRERKEAMFDQGLLIPVGLDEHYERIRKYEGSKFTSKGDPGWLVFYVTQVLHDLGNYSYDQRYIEFINKTETTCGNLTMDFAENFLDYANRSINLLVNLDLNVTKMQIIYDWVNDFVSYTHDTDGFGRFPVETLTCRFGDCEDQAMALSFLLEFAGYDTALCIIHDENFTQYDSDELYHVFCVVAKDGLEYNGTLIRLHEYEEEKNNWFVLDPAFNHMFGEDPEWMDYYRQENGTVSIPLELWGSLRVDYDEAFSRAKELGIL